MSINFPGNADIPIRERIPQLVLETDSFNSHFFAQVAPFLSEVLKRSENRDPSPVFINSGAPVRWALMKLFMGEQSQQVQSEPVGNLKELDWEAFDKKVEMKGSTREQKLVAYSLCAALSKLVIRDYAKGVEGEVASATDTVNYVKVGDSWTKMEKPKSLEEAFEQIDLLTSGAEFFVANASVIGKVGENGEFGMSMWMQPARYVFNTETEKEAVKGKLREKMKNIFADDETAKHEVRPGGVSSVDEIWINYLQVGFFDQEEKHEISELVRANEFSFDRYLRSKVSWFNLTGEELTDGKKVGIGATIIGGPVYGMKRAAEAYVMAIKKYSGRESFALTRKLVKQMSTTGNEI